MGACVVLVQAPVGGWGQKGGGGSSSGASRAGGDRPGGRVTRVMPAGEVIVSVPSGAISHCQCGSWVFSR
jgi:hypothetical protein